MGERLRSCEAISVAVGRDGVLVALQLLIQDIIAARNEHPYPAALLWCMLKHAEEIDGGLPGLWYTLQHEPDWWSRQVLPTLVSRLFFNIPLLRSVSEKSGMHPMERIMLPMASLLWVDSKPQRAPSILNTQSSHERSKDSDSDADPLCRICHSADPEEGPLFSPCQCTGSMKYVHMTCLRRWTADPRHAAYCEVCRQPYPAGVVRESQPASDGTPKGDAESLLWHYEQSEALRVLALERERARQKQALRARLASRSTSSRN